MVGELHTLRAGAQIASSSDDRPLTTDRTSLLTDGELPVVSVVICTYNRPQLLEAAVRSCLANATRTALKFEIIISDNSLDGHAHPIVTKFCDEAVVVRSVVASPPNIAIARNAGVKAARAPLIAFLDDDAEVYEGWLDALVGTLERTGADAAVGPVHAVFVGEAPKSDKLASRFSRMLSCASGTPIAATSDTSASVEVQGTRSL